MKEGGLSKKEKGTLKSKYRSWVIRTPADSWEYVRQDLVWVANTRFGDSLDAGKAMNAHDSSHFQSHTNYCILHTRHACNYFRDPLDSHIRIIEESLRVSRKKNTSGLF
jgi:hypothetical protein